MKHAKNNFDGLRLIGALLVLVSHQVSLQGQPEPELAGATLGQYGVAIFFGISGHLITGSWFADPNIFRFFAKRFLRIWPALTFLIGVLWAACHYLPWVGMDQIKMLIASDQYLVNLWLFDYWDWSGFFASNPNGFLDGSLWTIPIEVKCYLIVGFSFFLLERRARWLFIPAMGVVLFLPGWPFILLSCFLSGSAMKLWKNGYLAPLVLAVIGAGNLKLFLLLCIATAAVEIGRRSWPALRSAGDRGDFSYGLYLWAWPMSQVGILLFGGSWVWTVAATGCAAWLSWHLIESPALRLKPQSSQQLKPVAGLLTVEPVRKLP